MVSNKTWKTLGFVSKSRSEWIQVGLWSKSYRSMKVGTQWYEMLWWLGREAGMLF